MIIDPYKLALSIGASCLILVAGIGILTSGDPGLVLREFSPSLLVQEFTQPMATDSQVTVALKDDENAQEYSQMSPENAKIEAEAMTASIQTSNFDNSDWSLELISDHALELTQ